MARVVLIDELRKSQRAGQTCRPAADDDNVSFHLRAGDVFERPAEDHALAFFTSSMRGGTISNRLPTTPKSAISKIGASESLLIAMMERAPFMPTICWIAPLIPSAR